MPPIADRIAHAAGRTPVRCRPAGSGASGSITRAEFADGSTLIAKLSRHDEADLTLEARGLRLLADRAALPVPRVIAAEPDLLLLEDMPGSSAGLHAAEADAARLLAALHAVTAPDGRYGLDHDNLIGPLAQINTPSASWVEFFRDRRLLPMTEAAAREGAIPAATARRLEALSSRLGSLVPDHPASSLVHGDVWSGNVLADGSRVTAFLDPSVAYADAEVELAFITLFSTFGPAFFEAYNALRGRGRAEHLEFERTRRPVYNLYPLLVHVRLFGDGYLGDLEAALRSVGG